MAKHKQQIDSTLDSMTLDLASSISNNVITKINTPVQQGTIVYDLKTNPVLNPQLNMDMLINQDQVSDQELIKVLSRYFDTVLTLENIRLICNKRMLNLFSQTISNLAFDNRVSTDDAIPNKNKILWSRIMYETFIKKNINTFDTEIMDITLKLFSRPILRITGFGISKELAVKCMLARFSGGDMESLNVKNLNAEIMKSNDPMILNVQNIINIYETLFDSISALFTYTLYDFIHPDKILSDTMSTIISLQSRAVLEMLNMQTNQVIDMVLKNVSAEFTYNPTIPIRFSPLSISGDFDRIRNIAEWLNNNGVIMPR